ncbi:MAG: SDR family NAD(P)-dependent oxidoreductase [Erythrobacter sp.]
MTNQEQPDPKADNFPRSAAVFGSSGAIGDALCCELMKRGCDRIYAGSRDGSWQGRSDGPAIHPFVFDLKDEMSIQDAADVMKQDPPECVVVATGVLTLPDGTGPERTYKRLSSDTMAEVFALNTIGPALIAKHMLPLIPRDRRFVFAALSARVGSISNNGLGGWHSYRASKSALNMLLKNFALEIGRTHKESVIVGIHPGTVDSALSQPFQSNLPDGQLTSPHQAAANMVTVLTGLKAQDSGKTFDFAGKEIPA